MRPSSEILRNVLQSPSSPFAEAIRSIKLTLDLQAEEGKGKKVIGLTSSMPGEGKSSIAAAVAAGLAQSGKSVVLIDGDFRNPSLSRMLAPDASVRVHRGRRRNRADLQRDLEGSEHGDGILARWSRPGTASSSAEILLSPAAKSLFMTLQLKYDYVIVDLAPLIAGVEVRATSRLIELLRFGGRVGCDENRRG